MDFDSLLLDLHAQKNKVACSIIIFRGKTQAGAVLGGLQLRTHELRYLPIYPRYLPIYAP